MVTNDFLFDNSLGQLFGKSYGTSYGKALYCRTQILPFSRVVGAALAILFLIYPHVASAQNKTTRVSIDSGVVAGIAHEELLIYKGIPYAAAPVGELRWRPPQPVTPWSETFVADEFGPYCMQSAAPFPMPAGFEKSEDCLTLNIWTPANALDTPKAVMVWIHGGGFSWGSGSLPRLNGSELARQGVVVVTINYRLGAFGAFAHPSLSSQQNNEPIGNYQLMDQIAALRWVKRNITKFGGDPDNVTIFGESAGGIAINYLMVSPASKGLFNRAISQSGPVMLDGSKKKFVKSADGGNESMEAMGVEVAKQFGIAEQADVAKALRAVPATEIAELSAGRSMGWPMIDGYLVPDAVPILFSNDQQHDVSYMAGNNSWEGSLQSALPHGDTLYQTVDRNKLNAVYGDIDEDTLSRLFFEDFMFYSPIKYLTTRMASKTNSAYLYHFSYLSTFLRPFLKGAPHASDINYIFNTLPQAILEFPMPEFLVSDKDRQISTQMLAYWTQFAKTGNPNGEGRPRWLPCDANKCPTLDIGETIKLQPNLFEKRMNFHRSLLEQRLIKLRN